MRSILAGHASEGKKVTNTWPSFGRRRLPGSIHGRSSHSVSNKKTFPIRSRLGIRGLRGPLEILLVTASDFF
jgi:hypothetical protein